MCVSHTFPTVTLFRNRVGITNAVTIIHVITGRYKEFLRVVNNSWDFTFFCVEKVFNVCWDSSYQMEKLFCGVCSGWAGVCRFLFVCFCLCVGGCVWVGVVGCVCGGGEGWGRGNIYGETRFCIHRFFAGWLRRLNCLVGKCTNRASKSEKSARSAKNRHKTTF